MKISPVARPVRRRRTCWAGRHPTPAKRLDDYPHQFSGGMRQRVMIAWHCRARRNCSSPDEPEDSLDVTIQAQIVELIKKLQAELGTAVIWISHGSRCRCTPSHKCCRHVCWQHRRKGAVDEPLCAPGDPYTIGLLNSLPRLDATRTKPTSGDWWPAAQLLGVLTGCPFAPRCSFATDICRTQHPPVAEIVAGHTVACWHPQLDARGGWYER